MRPRRTISPRIARGAVALGVIVSLTGCSYVDRVALRLNDDHTVDLLSCETLDRVTGARLYLDGDLSASFDADKLVDFAGGLQQGDVVHLENVPASDDDWETLNVSVDGTLDSRDWEVDGFLRRDDLRVGKWSWARTGIFIGTVPVEGCEAND